MTNRLKWSDPLPDYDLGLDRGVFYPSGGDGEPWNGLVAVNEDADSENPAVYIDGEKIVNRRTAVSFSGSISAFTYTESFEQEAFTARRPKSFGLSYRTQMGKTYFLHLVYNVLVAPSSVTRQKQDDLDPFEWDFSTTPAKLPEGRLGAHIVINASRAYPWTLEALENILYGTDASSAYLPSPMDVYQLFEDNSMLIVVDNGDGTFTVTGPDEVILTSGDTFEISWPSAKFIDSDTYSIYSL